MAIGTVLSLLPLVAKIPAVERLLGKATNKAQENSVGMAVMDIAKEVMGVSKDSEVTAEKVREHQHEIERQVSQQEHEIELALLSDRADARDMYAESRPTTDKIAQRVMRWNVPYVVGLVIVQILVVYFLREHGTLIAIVGNVVGFVVAQLLTERSDIIGFYFGSSEGSKAKDRMNFSGKK